MKVPVIRDFLSMGYTPKQVAERVGCSLSHVYAVKGKSDIAELKEQVAELRRWVRDVYYMLSHERPTEPVPPRPPRPF